MKEVREKAFRLRLKGYSYNEINRELGVPKSTLSGWFSNLVLSESARERLDGRRGIGTQILIKRNKLQTHLARQRAAKILQASKKEIGILNTADLRLIGTALYWAEGYKRAMIRDGKEVTSHTISFTNSDSAMLRLFIEFLIQVVGILNDNIRASMRLYPHINEKEALHFWSRETGIPQSQFRKTTWLVSRASKSKRPYNRLTFGTLNIEVANTEKFYRIMGWIERLKNDKVTDWKQE